MNNLIAQTFILFACGIAFSNEVPTVALFTTGGTIQSKGAHRLTLTEYNESRVSPNELIHDLPEINSLASIQVHEISNVGSGNINTKVLLDLSKSIQKRLAESSVAGAVVTHGTGTLEETAYFLQLTVRSKKPVVVVGAMRPFTAISRDGPYNLFNAIKVAASPESEGQGVLVVLNDIIHSARFVTKGHTMHIETFVDREIGPLGFVDSDRIVFYRQPNIRHTYLSEFNIQEIDDLPQVDIVYGYQEASPIPISALVESGAKGIVLADSSPAYANAILSAQSNDVFIVQSDRKGAGRVPLSDRSLAKRIVTSDNLNPQKSRILLRLALTQTTDIRSIQRMFNEY